MSNYCSTEYFAAIIGVLGTLAGTVLGWILNSLSSKGKIKIFVSSWEDKFLHQDGYGGMASSSSIEDTEFYTYELSIDVYNSSSESKIMRDVMVSFNDGKKDIEQSTPNDDRTKHGGNPLWFYRAIGPITIPPKTVVNLKLHNGSNRQNGGLDYIWKTKKVFIKYRDEHNNQKRVLIKSEPYSEYFALHKQNEAEE